MASSLSRLFSSVTNFSAANPARHSTILQPLPPFVTDRVMRFFCSSTQHTPLHQDNLVKEQPEAPRQNHLVDNRQSQEQKDDADEDGGHVNKETGEIGGPKGPEPTRYGDWERKGRCYDF